GDGGDTVRQAPAPRRSDLDRVLARDITTIGRPLEGEGVASVDVLFRPDYGILDGRYANNGWLQECPRPVTMLTWNNAALVSPALAQRLGLENGRLIRLGAAEEAAIELPVWITPGQAENCVTVQVGYGRTSCGSVGEGVGTDVFPLRRTTGMWTSTGVMLTPLSGRAPLATTQEHHSMEGRDIVRVQAQDRFLEPVFAAGQEAHGSHGESHGDAPNEAHGEEEHGEGAHESHGHDYGGHGGLHNTSLYPRRLHSEHQWGMVIDQSTCTGCNACVVSCQSENNIPVVGMEEVARGREMQWIRIDRYYQGDPGNPRVVQQPLTCMHCENAPCEVVCPVAATVHSPEGLNQMVYNRCVGTRYCSNNCPYKVRRFNFFKYSDTETESLKLGRNPDVTVRTRGVMEKCSYCVQRISSARIEAKKNAGQESEWNIDDGQIKTACQQVCPSEAITFGDINDPESKVARLRKLPSHYSLLEELNTIPRTTYLAKTLNPNPVLLAVLGEEMPDGTHEKGHGSDHGGDHEGHGAGHGTEVDSHEG
ncbi:MAG: 4Fe-4S dicluster domain-containing protein, partial [Planctomycetota bacterium]